MDIHWSLTNNKSPQVPRTLLSILADIYNAVVWIVLLVLRFLVVLDIIIIIKFSTSTFTGDFF